MHNSTVVSDLLLSLDWPKPVQNLKSSDTYYISPYTRLYQLPHDPITIAKLCNQDAIYNFLFKKKLAGKPYEVDYAKGFLDWSNQGWESSEYFVFLIRNSSGIPVACIDIKDCNLKSSEIGYWCSAEVSGLMTNSVRVILRVADSAEFEKLTAITHGDNHRSQKVLLNNGFTSIGEFHEEGDIKLIFEKRLRAEQ